MSDQEITDHNLHQIARQFRQWRARYHKKHYPKGLWEDAYQLVAKHPLRRVARALGVQPHHLRTKMKSALCGSNKAPQFVEVLMPSIERQPQTSSVELRISQGADLEMAVKFEGSVYEVMPIVEHFFGRGKST